MKEEEVVRCLDIEERRGLADKEAKDVIKEHGLSIRQISRLTGISFGIVRK